MMNTVLVALINAVNHAHSIASFYPDKADDLKYRARIFKEGINFVHKGEIPEWLKPHMPKEEVRPDPDYELYLKLHKKFGDKE